MHTTLLIFSPRPIGADLQPARTLANEELTRRGVRDMHTSEGRNTASFQEHDLPSIGTLPRMIMLMPEYFVSLPRHAEPWNHRIGQLDALGKLWKPNCTSQSCTMFASLSKAIVAANFHVSSRPWKSVRFAPTYQFPYSGYGRRSSASPQHQPLILES